MFGVFRIAKARKACVQALQPFVARPQILGSWPPQFWRDPFVIGFVVYVIATISNLVTRGKLKTEQRGHVLIGTLKEVGGYSPEFMDRVAALTRAKDPAFMLGGRNAETVVTYVMNLQCRVTRTSQQPPTSRRQRHSQAKWTALRSAAP